MKRIYLILMLAVVSATMNAQQEQLFRPDPAVRVGHLKNGLTYYIRHNEEPKDRAYFYIAQKVGAIQEEPHQRGLAHFLEHMCFNGTKHFPGNRLREYLETIGVKFGADLNAYTAVDETVYNIDNVPVTVGGAIDSCLWILHDWSHDLLLEGDEIDKFAQYGKSAYERAYDACADGRIEICRLYAYRFDGYRKEFRPSGTA